MPYVKDATRPKPPQRHYNILEEWNEVIHDGLVQPKARSCR